MTAEEMLGIKEKATEETLQSIDITLKRIENHLQQNSVIITLKRDDIDLDVLSKTVSIRLQEALKELP
ncbi:hypothetical protein [Acetivibrio ethanolgignens]|uniref:Uncharacterized protein n=1 Tax=Acetivibrio ethanolgignens TaxID=290052 RepID=A0A0V8QI49_9FIRM|nr:hypothetical protein [Acetivibrio ethanolgignens]KSV60283.1 hypothetical protein ASU35_05885 [Acetivibrio ethanolgignens]